jgi:hypothetical protein
VQKHNDKSRYGISTHKNHVVIQLPISGIIPNKRLSINPKNVSNSFITVRKLPAIAKNDNESVIVIVRSKGILNMESIISLFPAKIVVPHNPINVAAIVRMVAYVH